MIKFSRLREFSLHFNSDYQELNTGITIFIHTEFSKIQYLKQLFQCNIDTT